MFKKILHTFGTRLATAVISFLIAVAVSQSLGAAGKGEQGILITSIALILIFSNIVGGASLVYLVPRYPLKRLVLPAYVWSLITGFMLAAVFVFLRMIPAAWFWHVALLSVLNSWISIHSSLMIGQKRIGRSNILNLAQTALTLISLLLMVGVFKWLSVEAYIISLYIAYIFALVLSVVMVVPVFRVKEKDTVPFARVLGALFRYGYMNQLAHIAQILSFRVSYYFLDSISGEKAVGIYSNGVSLMESVWMISGSIALVQYSDIANSNDRVWAAQLSAKLSRYAIWASLLIILPMVWLPPAFYVFIFGPEFSEVSNVMRWLAPGVLVFNYALILGHYFSGTGRYYVNAVASGAGLLLTLLLCILLIPLYGTTGAAIAAIASYLLTSVVVFWIFSRESRISPARLLPRWSDLSALWNEGRSYLAKLRNHE